MGEEMVTIKKSEHEQLLRDSRELEELDACGVDNWRGYEFIDWEYVNTGKQANYDD